MLILSIFPGLDFLGRAFEEELGACVVRGPDVIWGGDIRTFHPPAGVFDGIIGGPPCQMFSTLAPLVRHNGHEPAFGNLIPEYERVVAEAQPRWFVMENVRGAPLPEVDGYDRWSGLVTDIDVGGVQPRERRISFGLREPHGWDVLTSPFTLLEYAETVGDADAVAWGDGRKTRDRPKMRSTVGDAPSVPVKLGGSGKPKVTVHGGHSPAPGQRPSVIGEDGKPRHTEGASVRMNIGDMLEAQGMPRDYLDHAPFTSDGKRKAIGNGVPLPMGRAIAAMVARVFAIPAVTA